MVTNGKLFVDFIHDIHSASNFIATISQKKTYETRTAGAAINEFGLYQISFISTYICGTNLLSSDMQLAKQMSMIRYKPSVLSSFDVQNYPNKNYGDKFF